MSSLAVVMSQPQNGLKEREAPRHARTTNERTTYARTTYAR